MSSLVVHRASEIPFYQGPHQIPGIRFRPARAALGVNAWGMNILELEPACSGHPEHSHGHDGQEEVYVVLSGELFLLADGQEVAMSQGDMVRVPPEVTRQLVTRSSGAMVLALGATPGAVYEAGEGM